MSYRKHHIKHKIQKIKPKKRFFQKAWFWLIVAVVLAILASAYFYFFFPSIWIKNVAVSGNSKVATSEIQSFTLDSAKTKLLNFWFFHINSESIISANAKKIQKDILGKFPEIEQAQVTKAFPSSLSVAVSERKPVAVYCQDNCFLIDENGVVFEKTGSTEPGLFIVRQNGQENQFQAGQSAVQKTTMNFIYKIQKVLEENFKINIKEALIANSLRLNVKTSEDWQIYFDLASAAAFDQQIVKLNLLLKEGTDRSKLYYIDLRPQDRAIICDNSLCGAK